LSADSVYSDSNALRSKNDRGGPADFALQTPSGTREWRYGVVYKALDLSLDRLVAIKLLPAEFISNPDRCMRFVREAKSASALNHPGIVTIYEIDTDHEQPFIVMEYVEGQPLHLFMGKRRLSVAEALNLGIHISDALAAAHRAGIVHRDVKPANIIVGSQGRAKVLDFGLAKLIAKGPVAADESTEAMDPQTREGVIFGTAAYMSPEQAQGGPIDSRSDIFSFGAVLYEMATGRRAFSGSTTISTLAAVLNQEPRPATEIAIEVPREMERIISRCLRKDPARRFQHMDDVKVALQELKEEREAGTLGATRKTRRLPRRALFGFGTVALATAAIATVWYVLGWRTPPAMVTGPLTSYPGYERHPSFSPDGRQVAFSWNGEKQDNYDIYVVLTSGGPPLRLTTNSARDTAPTWSPDGRYIAYIRDPGPSGAVYLISPLGGPDRKIAETKGHSVCWTSDSTAIGASNETSGMSLVSIASGQHSNLTTAPWGLIDDDCAFSEDGKYLAFVRWSTSYSGNVYVSSSTGADPHRITAEENWIDGLAWMPTSAELLVGTTETGTWRLGLARLSAHPRSRAEISRYVWAQEGSSPSISKPSRSAPLRLVYERAVTDLNLYRVDLSTTRYSGDAVPIKRTIFAPSTRVEMDPQFSPDGRKLAFASDRSGSAAIWLCASDGSDLVQVTNVAECAAGSPHWSPDSRQIAFDCASRRKFGIYVVSAASGPARPLTDDPSHEILPSWSHDGRSIYFCSTRSGSSQVWKVAAEGGRAVQVTRGGGYESFESPDGKLLYYSKEKLPGLWSVPVEGGPETRVLDSVRHFGWAGADTGIYFVTFHRLPLASASSQINFYSFKTQTVVQVGTIVPELPLITPSLTVSRDGRRLVVVQGDQAGSDLVLVDNFR
jgi:serine/threonine protein kinase